MHRNYMHRSCGCGCNSNMEENSNDYIEESCSNVSNSLDMYYNECECGYDEYNSLPQNPLLRSKLCSNSKNERNIYTTCRIKDGNYFP